MFNNCENKYFIIEDKLVGKGIKQIWNGSCLLVKLENDDFYKDDILNVKSNLSKLENEIGKNILQNNNGYMLISQYYKIDEINTPDKIIKSFILMNNKGIDLNNTLNIINTKLNEIKQICINNDNKIIIPKISKTKINKIFDDNDVLYIKNIQKKSFVEFANQNTEENSESLQKINAIKKILIDKLMDQDSFDINNYYEFDKTLIYKYPVEENDNVDTLGFGKMMIDLIIDGLNDFEIDLKNIDGKPIGYDDVNVFEEYTLFDFLKFEIIGDHIEIFNIYANPIEPVITETIVPNLKYLTYQYNKPINYSRICYMLSSLTSVNENSEIVNEILKITSQEYIIAFQPKINLLIWTIVRIIICWFADEELYKNIYKLRILINLYDSRNKKDIIEPLITIHTSYGKSHTLYALSHFNLYFFRFKDFGNKNCIPTYYKTSDKDNLICYTNGSTKMKECIKMIGKNTIVDKVYNDKMVYVNTNNNEIEFNIDKHIVEQKKIE